MRRPTTRRWGALVFCTLACLVAVPAVASADECANADVVPTAHNARVVSTAVLCLLNVERANHGLAPLRANTSLRTVAKKYAKKMVKQRFFGHTTPSGETFAKRIKKSRYPKGTKRWSSGENIAYGEGHLSTPREIVNHWMHSPGHRANILNPDFRDIGLGVVPGTPSSGAGAPSAGATFVNEFGRRVLR